MAYRKHREDEDVRPMSFRLPVWLYEEIERRASANRRSKGAEIVEILERALEEHDRATFNAAEDTPDYGKSNGTEG